jgi:DNA-binding IclR family transcriptional regulator
MQDRSPAPGTAPSLRNLLILEVISRAERPLTATEINDALKLPKPTIHRLVNSLEEDGYLTRHFDGRSYLPGPRLREMMLGVMRASYHLAPQRAVLRGLNAAIGETCNLSIPDGDEMVYADRIETHWPLRVDLQIGSRVPMHATSAGKAALAFIPETLLEKYLRKAELRSYTPFTICDRDALREEIEETRSRGYSTESEEFVSGMIAIGVPVKDRTGKLCATLSFHAPKQRLDLEAGLKHLPILQKAAGNLGDLIDDLS